LKVDDNRSSPADFLAGTRKNYQLVGSRSKSEQPITPLMGQALARRWREVQNYRDARQPAAEDD
jgi:hypothetical protein